MSNSTNALVLAYSALVLVTSLSIGLYLHLFNSEKTIPLNDDEVLICHIKNIDGFKAIDRDKIVEYDPVTGYWIFTNGYSRHCYIKKRK